MAYDAAVQMIDTSIVHQHGACITNNNGQHIGRSRGGLTSKIHVVLDGNGLPVRLGLTGGQAHDYRLCSVLLHPLLSRAVVGRSRLRRGLDQGICHRTEAWANIPPKSNRKGPICFSPYLYRARNLVERFFNKIKHCRRVATRYDKLAANYLAFVKLACIRLWLRVYEFSHVDGPFKGLGVRGAKRGCFAIGAVKQGNGCRYASAWRALLGDVGKRLDGLRRVLASTSHETGLKPLETNNLTFLTLLMGVIYLDEHIGLWFAKAPRQPSSFDEAEHPR